MYVHFMIDVIDYLILFSFSGRNFEDEQQNFSEKVNIRIQMSLSLDRPKTKY